MGNQQQPKKSANTNLQTTKQAPPKGNISKKQAHHPASTVQGDDEYQDERLITLTIDRRKQVGQHDLEFYPHNCLGPLISRSGYEKCFATGFLISSCLVLTSAHSFYNIDQITKESIKEFKPQLFYIDIQTVLEDNKAIKIVDFRLCQKFIDITDQMLALHVENTDLSSNHELPQEKIIARKKEIKEEMYRLKKSSESYDYALLKLEKLIDRPQYPILSPQFEAQNTKVTVCGLCEGPPDNCTQFIHSNTLFVEATGGLYDIDTKAGQSGAMVYLTGDKSKVVGVHKGFDPRRKLNACTLVSREMILDLQRWVGEFGLQNVIFGCDSIPFPYPNQQGEKQVQAEAEYDIVEAEYDQPNLNNEERLKLMKNELQKLVKKNKALTQKLKKEQTQKERIRNEFVSYKVQTQKQLNSLPKQKQQSNQPKPIKIPFPFSHEGNEDNNRFETIVKDSLVRLIYMVDNDGYWYSFIKNGEIPQDSVTVFKIKQVKTEYKRIFTGIATNSVFGMTDAFQKSRQTVSYRSQNGKVWQNGLSRAGKREIKDGEVILLTVDTSSWSLKWSISQEQLAVCTIPPNMREKPLYLIIMMAYRGDTVDLLYD